MRILKGVLFALCMAFLFGTFAPGARADEWDKKTIVTFNDAVEIPGQVLEPGTYIFKLMDSSSDRHIVQILNEDQSQIITTILAIPNYRAEPTDESDFQFDERSGNSPMALRAWFYPGDQYGQEFTYSYSLRRERAQLR